MIGFLKSLGESIPEPVKETLAVAAYVAVTVFASYHAYHAGKKAERANHQSHYERGWHDGVSDTVEYLTEKHPSILEERIEARKQGNVESEVESLIEKEINSDPLLPSNTSE